MLQHIFIPKVLEANLLKFKFSKNFSKVAFISYLTDVKTKKNTNYFIFCFFYSNVNNY